MSMHKAMPSKPLRLSSKNGRACSFKTYFFLYHERNIKSDKSVCRRKKEEAIQKETRQWTHPLAIIGCGEKIPSRKIRFCHVTEEGIFHPRARSECSLNFHISLHLWAMTDCCWFSRVITCRWLVCVTEKKGNDDTTRPALFLRIVLHSLFINKLASRHHCGGEKKDRKKRNSLHPTKAKRKENICTIDKGIRWLDGCVSKPNTIARHIHCRSRFSRPISRSRKKVFCVFLCYQQKKKKRAFISCSVFDVNALDDIPLQAWASSCAEIPKLLKKQKTFENIFVKKEILSH